MGTVARETAPVIAPAPSPADRPVTPPPVAAVDLPAVGPTATGLRVTPEQQAATEARYRAWVAARDADQPAPVPPTGATRC